MSDISTDNMSPDAQQPRTHLERAQGMRIALNKVSRRDSIHPTEPLLEEEVQRICYWYKILDSMLSGHLDNMHDAILRTENLTMTQSMTNIERHDKAQSHLLHLHEVTWTLGTKPGGPRKHINPEPVLSYPVQSWLSDLRVNIRVVLSNIRRIEKDLTDANNRDLYYATGAATEFANLILFKHQLVSQAYQLPELTELFRHIGMDLLEEFITRGAPDAHDPMTEFPARTGRQRKITNGTTCFICWENYNEPPHYFAEQPEGEVNVRPYPASAISGPSSMIQAPCCVAIFHKSCLCMATLADPKCPHCQQALPSKWDRALARWWSQDFSRKSFKLFGLMVKEIKALGVGGRHLGSREQR